MALLSDKLTAPVITGLVGLLAGMLLSGYESDLSTNRFFLEKQIETADEVADHFSVYIENWRRVVSLKRYILDQGKGNVSDSVMSRFEDAVKMRNSSRDHLFNAFDSLGLYFDERVTTEVSQFRKWDGEQALKTIDELPPVSEWQDRQVGIISVIAEGITK